MWLQLTSIDRVTEFDKHYCDRDLRNFLRGEPDMFAEIGVPSLRINQPVSGGGDTSAVWDDEGYTEAGNGVTSPINSPQNPQNLNVQPRQRRPRAH